MDEQLQFHMLFGHMIVRALLPLVAAFGRLPGGLSRCYARLLNAAASSPSPPRPDASARPPSSPFATVVTRRDRARPEGFTTAVPWPALPPGQGQGDTVPAASAIATPAAAADSSVKTTLRRGGDLAEGDCAEELRAGHRMAAGDRRPPGASPRARAPRRSAEDASGRSRSMIA
ncbi:MAG TPA: hypothetical protein VGG25_20185 [Streptosporangiaceae bacterium]